MTEEAREAVEVVASEYVPDQREREALGMRDGVEYCWACVDAYRNGIEPGGSACDHRAQQECPSCGLPMSYADYGAAENSPVWICDAPNDGTTKRGCGDITPAH